MDHTLHIISQSDFFSTLCFWDLSIFIYAHFHCFVVFYLFIHSLVGGYVDDFQFFPIISNVILDSFFYARHRTLLMFNLLVAGWLSSGIWWRVPSLTARVRISPEVNCRVEGHAHLRFSRPCQVALQWLYQFISPPAAYESFCLSTLHPYKYLVVALFNYFTNMDMKWYLHTV